MEHKTGPDFLQGVSIEGVPDGGLLEGRVGEEKAVLARRGNEFFVVGAECTHYHGPLAKGLIVGDELRCPWHHACFSLRTGEVVRTPAFDPIPCWRVERVGNDVFVREKLPAATRRSTSPQSQHMPKSVVIVGGGAAGFAAADTLRREGYDGAITMISADEFAPYDRPNLSKDYLAGSAPDEWMPLRSPDYYADQRIELLLKTRVTSIDTRQKHVAVENGRTYEFDRLLLATGADPVKLSIPGMSESQLHYLRTYADCRALVTKVSAAKQVVMIGGSFIGLEVAASLRERNIGVHVVALEKEPLERVMGPDVGRFIRSLHEARGVMFHLEDSVARIEGRRVILKSGAALEADLVILGVGVRPSVTLAEHAGLKVDQGVLVDAYLETSTPGIFAAGDIARWPDARSGELIRVEHWVVAERQGQTAARNMLGQRERFAVAPFFWTQQHGVSIRYVGHAQKWDTIDIDGHLDAKDCAVTYKRDGRTLAVATISRDLQNLQAEVAMETNSR